ncbi:MAG: NAD(P)-dependent alcohol dehydrogenase [Alphaproteobacteria bacterium]|nr:MAG: NAD(P)-dependent alcohol dehydrogenase [Alphaproteobacteria bacterium]
MKVFELQDFGGTDSLKMVERDQPKPGYGQIVIMMKAASLNYRDLITVGGGYGRSVQTPLVPLSDGCGEVIEVGEGVTRFQVGDRVAPCFFTDWVSGPVTLEGLISSLGGGRDGVAQELMVLDQHGAVRVPDYLSDLEAATLPCAALTAWRGLMVEGGLKAGERVLLLGTGGVSIFGLQIAKAAGAEVIITSSSDEKLARAKKLGADHTINYREHHAWSQEVRKIVGLDGIDHVLEVGGVGTLKQSMMCMKPGGHVSLIGVVAGDDDKFRLGAAVAGNLKLQAISVGSRAQFEDMNKAFALHQIKPVIDKVYSFDDLPKALEDMRGASHFGKIAIEF